MARNQIDRENGLPVDFPGKALLSLDKTEGPEPAIVTVYAAIPSRGYPSIVRLNLFSELMGVRQHFASAFLTAGQNGTVMSVTGFLADSWHVYGQASLAQQDVQVGLVSTPCCADPLVIVRPEFLALAFPAEPIVPASIAGLFRAPFVPMGGPNGASSSRVVSGTGLLGFPNGSRLTHYIADGSGALSAIQIHRPPAGDISLTIGPTRIEAFPLGLEAVSSIDFQSLNVGFFEFVV